MFRQNIVPLHPLTQKCYGNVRDLAQLVAHTSGGREVAGSSPVIPTERKRLKIVRFEVSFFFVVSLWIVCLALLQVSILLCQFQVSFGQAGIHFLQFLQLLNQMVFPRVDILLLVTV